MDRLHAASCSLSRGHIRSSRSSLQPLAALNAGGSHVYNDGSVSVWVFEPGHPRREGPRDPETRTGAKAVAPGQNTAKGATQIGMPVLDRARSSAGSEFRRSGTAGEYSHIPLSSRIIAASARACIFVWRPV